ncbi:MAG: type II toxin-antitoxin system Phd/YefM family antitoxin [Candidatus Izemoplasmatales bacterium]
MLIATEKIISVTEANQNFSKLAKKADTDGYVMIFKRNKPAYVMFDVDKMTAAMKEEFEKMHMRLMSEQLIAEYGEAYGKLAK